MKHYIRLLAVYCTISLLAIAGLLSGCKDYSKTLPNGYVLVRTSAHEVSIGSPKPPRKVVISANIDGYSVISDLVVGHVSIPDIPNIWYEVIPGYFVLDTKSDEDYQGLDKMEWLELLKDYGITKEPNLKSSTRFDKNY